MNYQTKIKSHIKSNLGAIIIVAFQVFVVTPIFFMEVEALYHHETALNAHAIEAIIDQSLDRDISRC